MTTAPMYLTHFGLGEPPFKITPHPAFFYAGANRGATLDGLLYAVTSGEGIVKVTGEVGSGKTMLCRMLIDKLGEHVGIVYLANPSYSRDEILYAIADELHLDIAGLRQSAVLRLLQENLVTRYAQNRQVVVLIDEAHAMPPESLEEIRLLSNLESGHHKLLQMVLFGQPELNATLADSTMRQLRERIVHSFELEPLRRDDVGQYLLFRLRAAGYKGPDNFAAAAIRLIAEASQGLTRRINILADKALLAAFADNVYQVEPRHVKRAIDDSEFTQRRRPPGRLAWVGGALLIGLLAGAVAGFGLRGAGPLPAIGPALQRPLPAAAGRMPVASGPAVAAPAAVAVAPVAAAAPATAAVVAPAADAGAAPAQFPLLQQRLQATRRWLDSSAPQQISIQLMLAVGGKAAQVEDFLHRAGTQVSTDELHVYQSGSSASGRLGVMYGLFEDRAAARQALQRLPPVLKASRPIFRTIRGIREEINVPG